MKTNKLIDEIRKSTPADTNKQVDLCVAIANRVFELLQERNMKQRDFAKALGKTETEVSRWLSGTHNLTLATIAKMATVLGDDIIQCNRSADRCLRRYMADRRAAACTGKTSVCNQCHRRSKPHSRDRGSRV